MRVAVLGAAGKIGRLVVEGLVAEGHQVVGLVRSDEQAALVSGLGASAVQGDLEGDLSEVLAGAQAAVFAAGASLGGDPERVDRDACIAAQRAAEAAGVTRWVQVSSLMADRPQEGPPFLFGFLSAKRASDDALAETGLAWTVVRPGGLQDTPGTGLVEAGHGLPSGVLPRADVAAAVVATLEAANTHGMAYDLISGGTPIAEAIAAL